MLIHSHLWLWGSEAATVEKKKTLAQEQNLSLSFVFARNLRRLLLYPMKKRKWSSARKGEAKVQSHFYSEDNGQRFYLALFHLMAFFVLRKMMKRFDKNIKGATAEKHFGHWRINLGSKFGWKWVGSDWTGCPDWDVMQMLSCCWCPLHCFGHLFLLSYYYFF